MAIYHDFPSLEGHGCNKQNNFMNKFKTLYQTFEFPNQLMLGKTVCPMIIHWPYFFLLIFLLKTCQSFNKFMWLLTYELCLYLTNFQSHKSLRPENFIFTVFPIHFCSNIFPTYTGTCVKKI